MKNITTQNNEISPAKADPYIKTKDINLVAYLKSEGFNWVTAEKSPIDGMVYFSFESSPEVVDLRDAFFRGLAWGDLRKFCLVQNDIKDYLFQVKLWVGFKPKKSKSLEEGLKTLKIESSGIVGIVWAGKSSQAVGIAN